MKNLTPGQVHIVSALIFIIGFLFVGGGALQKNALMGIGIVIMLGAVAFRFAFYRCPHCKRYLGRSMGSHCPYCGKDLNS
jgi:rRNA maturation endonuclease Nob1